MSQSRERTSKDCLNCGTLVQGRFCHVCGQENIETRESFWSLTKHFVFDILHFDGKFWLTLRRLCTQPGRVAKDYVSGKRVPYVHPIRMYLFTSAVFFLAFFNIRPYEVNIGNRNAYGTQEDREDYIDLYRDRMAMVPADSFLQQRIALLEDTTRALDMEAMGWWKKGERLVTIDGKPYRSVTEYDSMQKLLPSGERDNFLKRAFSHRQLTLESNYETQGEWIKEIIELFLHRLPYLLFLSLPFFAGILNLLYSRRKQFAYSDHAVFTLYHYVLSFLIILFTFLNAELRDATGWKWLGILQAGAFILWIVYLYLQMKRFYGAGRTFWKFVLLNFLASILLAVLFVLFLLISVFI